jgi:hypothetical protein
MSLAHRNMPCHVQISQCPELGRIAASPNQSDPSRCSHKGATEGGVSCWPQIIGIVVHTPCRLFPFEREI